MCEVIDNISKRHHTYQQYCNDGHKLIEGLDNPKLAIYLHHILNCLTIYYAYMSLMPLCLTNLNMAARDDAYNMSHYVIFIKRYVTLTFDSGINVLHSAHFLQTYMAV